MSPVIGIALLLSTWQNPEIIGYVDDSLLPEASGIAASAVTPDRLYHMNDSGNQPTIVVTSKDGTDPQLVRLTGIQAVDTEDLSVGRCPDQGSCLYVSDTGDNDAERSSVSIYAVRERDDYPDEIPVEFTLRLRFPDGAHNVESLAIHPSGLAYILTKEETPVLYRFAIPKLKVGATVDVTPVALGTLQLSSYLKASKSKQLFPTGMDIRSDGQQMTIICNAGAVVLNWDVVSDMADVTPNSKLSLNSLLQKKKRSVEILPFLDVPQPEAITYLPEGGLIYSTESNKSLRGRIPLVFVGGN